MTGDVVGAPPNARGADDARRVVDAGLTAVPVLGSAVQILLDGVFPPNLERRRQAWYRQVASAINEVHRRVGELEVRKLVDDQLFASALIRATDTAAHTDREEKLGLLKDALVGLAVSRRPSELTVTRFFQWIDELEPEHFLILEFAAGPEQWFTRKGIPQRSHYMGARSTLMEEAQLPVTGAELQLVLRELTDRALITGGSFNTTMTAEGMWQPFASDLGRELLAFVMRT